MENQTVDICIELYSFEPIPSTFAKLSAAVTSGPHVHLFNLALSDRVGNMTVFVRADSLETVQLSERQRAIELIGIRRDKHICINLTTMEKAVPLGPISFLKMDTQGHEGKVLLGAREFLKRGLIKRMYLEYVPEMLRDHDMDPILFLIFLRENGFRCIAAQAEGYQPKDGRRLLTEEMQPLPQVSGDYFAYERWMESWNPYPDVLRWTNLFCAHSSVSEVC